MTTHGQSLPPFLRSLETDAAAPTRLPIEAEFAHSERLGRNKSHSQWWPCQDGLHPKTLLLFIPGNPGLPGFYKPFLQRIHMKFPALAIFVHSHLGHSPFVSSVPRSYYGLLPQVDAAVEAVDAVTATYGTRTKVVLVGHSVGSWIIMQVLKERPYIISGAFLLFPTISHIASTPNGRSLSWIFRSPFRQILSSLTVVSRILSKSMVWLFFPDWPREQIDVLYSFICSSDAVSASLIMGGDEMHTILSLDVDVLDQHKHKIWVYLAEKDDWVGSNRDTIMREFADEPHSVRLVHGDISIPHAFCINHGVQLADQCLEWLEAGDLL